MRELHSGVSCVPQLKVFAVSVVQFLLQFVPPSKSLTHSYRRMLQRTVAGPWEAIPSKGLVRLKQLGFRTALPDLRTLSIASRARAGVCSAVMDITWNLQSSEQRFAEHPDALLHPRSLPWFATSGVWQMSLALEDPVVKENMDEAMSQGKIQAFLYGKLLESTPFDWGLLFFRRLSKRFGPIERLASDRALVHVKSLAAEHALLAWGWLKSICDAWATSLRFQDRDSVCTFCSAEQDSVHHMLLCPEIVEHLGHLLPLASAATQDHGLLALFGMIDFNTEVRKQVAVWHDCVLFGRNARVFGRSCVSPMLLFDARVREILGKGAERKSTLRHTILARS